MEDVDNNNNTLGTNQNWFYSQVVLQLNVGLIPKLLQPDVLQTALTPHPLIHFLSLLFDHKNWNKCFSFSKLGLKRERAAALVALKSAAVRREDVNKPLEAADVNKPLEAADVNKPLEAA